MHCYMSVFISSRVLLRERPTLAKQPFIFLRMATSHTPRQKLFVAVWNMLPIVWTSRQKDCSEHILRHNESASLPSLLLLMQRRTGGGLRQFKIRFGMNWEVSAIQTDR